jgi:hypothetical protein
MAKKKMRESSVTGQNSPYMHNNTNIPRRQFEFSVVTPLIDEIPARGRQYLLVQGSEQTFDNKTYV